MKDVYKKPIFYYVLVPLLLAIWPIWLFAFGLPGAKDSYKREGYPSLSFAISTGSITSNLLISNTPVPINPRSI